MHLNWRKSTLLLITLLLTSVCIWAQPKLNSPYSRIGLGDPFQQYMSSTAGYAGMSAAFMDRLQLNILNPAASSFMNEAALQVDVYAKNSEYEDPLLNVSDNIWSGNLANLAIGFPLNNRANDILANKDRKVFHGMTFALLPYSLVGYNVEISNSIAESPLDTVNYAFQGNGGTYRFVWGNSIRYNNFAFGLNIGYLFGKIENERDVTFPNLGASYRNEITDELSFQGFLWSFGLMYHKEYTKPGSEGRPIPTGEFLTIGMYGNSKNSFKSTSQQTFLRVSTGYGNTVRDSISQGEDVKFSGNQLPAEFTLGARYGDRRWDLGAEVGVGFWEGFENKAAPVDLSNTYRVAIGGSIQPKRKIPDLGREVRYSAGLFYQTDPRSDLFNEQLTNLGITLGARIPFKLRTQSAFTNFGLELGTIGTNEALKENYIKFTLGFTLNDESWFRKRKFY